KRLDPAVAGHRHAKGFRHLHLERDGFSAVCERREPSLTCLITGRDGLVGRPQKQVKRGLAIICYPGDRLLPLAIKGGDINLVTCRRRHLYGSGTAHLDVGDWPLSRLIRGLHKQHPLGVIRKLLTRHFKSSPLSKNPWTAATWPAPHPQRCPSPKFFPPRGSYPDWQLGRPPPAPPRSPPRRIRRRSSPPESA